MELDKTISNGAPQFKSARARFFITLQYARNGILNSERDINSSISHERQIHSTVIIQIQYRTMFLVLHKLPIVAYWIIYSEKANFVLDRKKYIMCKECGYLLPWGIERCRSI